MSRIATTFAQLKQSQRKALIPFITAGDPSLASTLSLMHAFVEAGADIIELGVPFSDPMADGPIIQLASERALAAGTRLVDVLSLVAQFRSTNNTTPVVLMGYLNPVESLGYAEFVEQAAQAGVDGVLLVDLPPEEGEEFRQLMQAKQLDVIYLIAPTTRLERARKICAQASGYLYYVSVKGVTGSASLDVAAVAAHLQELEGITDLPLAVGFGIRDGASAAALGAVSDGVVVGSALVNQIAANINKPEQMLSAPSQILAEMRQALDALPRK